jgi:diaminopimelate epimerase
VNFVARLPGQQSGFHIRTYERGVEGETLACGTGSMAAVILLAVWGESGLETSLTTRSGLTITGRLRREGKVWHPTLRGQGRLVFAGELATD